MTCDRARTLMLEADPAELRSDAGGELAGHLAACAACADLAARIVHQAAVLDDALDVLARRAAPVRKPRAWRRAAALVPLAAAAVLALLLVRSPGPLPPRSAPAAVPRTVVVNGGGTGGVAVMQTRNPDITVVWTF